MKIQLENEVGRKGSIQSLRAGDQGVSFDLEVGIKKAWLYASKCMMFTVGKQMRRSLPKYLQSIAIH